MRTTLLIAAALLSVTGPARAQFPRLFGGSTPAKQTITTGENPNRVMEIQVELAWLADPQTFPFYLEAHMEGPKLIVHGSVPNASVRAHALQVARLNSSVTVMDAIQENSAANIRQNYVPPAQLYTAILAAMAEGFAQLQPYLHVDCSADGKVVIRGQAPTFEHKLAISQAVRRLNGCTAVINRIQVGAMPASNVNPTQYVAGTGAAPAGSEPQQTRTVPNARGVMVPMHQPNTPGTFDAGNMSSNQPASPPKSSRPLFGWLNGTSPASNPGSGVVPPAPTPMYPAANQQPMMQQPTMIQQPGMIQQPTMIQQPATRANTTPMPIQQTGYQTINPSAPPAQGAMKLGTLTPSPTSTTQGGPSPFSPAVANSSSPMNVGTQPNGTTMQALRPAPSSAPAFRPASSPASGNQSYVTHGIVYTEEPAAKMPPLAAQPAPAVNQAALQQRVAAACGSDARACTVQVMPGNKLKIEVTVANPRMVEQRDQIQGLVRRILDIPEVQSYQMPEMLFQP